MNPAASSALGAALLLVLAWTALASDGSDRDGRDVPPATADLPRAQYAAPGAQKSMRFASWARAGAQGAEVEALEEVLAAAEGLQPIACELAAGGVRGYWPGRNARAVLSENAAAARRLDSGLEAARTDAGARILVEALLGTSGCRARLALGLLDRSEPTAAAPLLRGSLDDGQEDRRRRAALGLGAVESAPDRPALERLLADPASSVRIAAAWALGRIEDPAAIPALSRVLADDADPGVRGAAAEALGEIAG